MFHHHRNNNNNSTTMSRSRYEPVPQDDSHEIIELSDPSYNYNTAIPNSPPPSFHSSQSTPAVSVAGVDLEHERAFNNSTPRPVPSVIGATGSNAVAGRAGNDDALIMNLHRRVERLEESIGRLLLEKSERDSAAGSGANGNHAGSNCCVTFPDPSALSATERGELLRSGSNCCVRFGARKHGASSEERQKRREECWSAFSATGICLALMVWISLLVWLTHRQQVVGCESCGAGAGGSGQWSAAGADGDGAWSSSG